MTQQDDLSRTIDDYDFEQRVADELQRRHKWRWRALTAWVILFTLAVIFLYESVQISRLESCRQNYGAFNEVFKPFFPPKGAKTTTKQQNNIDKFHKTISDLRSQCRGQVKIVWDWSNK